jgi:predicted transcriptional regulator of viral defense system
MLPDHFRYSGARAHINERRLRELRAAGLIIQTGRGMYRKATAAGDDDLIEIAAKAPRASLCLQSALARHDLTDDIPSAIDIALPRHTWPPATRAPVTWHQFDPRTFDIGRATLRLDGNLEIGLYSPERCIIDAYRLRHLEGAETANQALRRWLRQGGQPSTLLRDVKEFPHAEPAIRRALEILL